MNIDPRTLAARLGSAVFERIARDGLLNREVIEDAIYREWLVFVEDQKSAVHGKATQRITAWLAKELGDCSPARIVADLDMDVADLDMDVADLDMDAIDEPQPGTIERVRDPALKKAATQPHSPRQLALAQHCAAAWMKKAAINSNVTWNGLTETTRKGWLSVAELILSRRPPGISVWAEDVREAYYKGCSADMIHAWADITQHSKNEWNAVVEALNPTPWLRRSTPF